MSETCTVPPEGWRCTRAPGHEGPCAAVIDRAHDKAGGLWYRRWHTAVTEGNTAATRIAALERDLAAAREGLAFYAAGIGFSEIDDNGDTARATLARITPPATEDAS